MIGKTSFRILLGSGVAMAFVLATILTLLPSEQPSHLHQAVDNIENYRKEHGKLPDQTDLLLLSKLEISQGTDFLLTYVTLDKDNYMLIKQEKEEGPVWYYDSREKVWAHGSPKLPSH